MPISHIGNASLSTPNHSFSLKQVLYVPNACKNILFVSQFARDNSVFFKFYANFFLIKVLRTGRILHCGPLRHRLYPLFSRSSPTTSPHALLGERTSAANWHHCLGHPNFRIVCQVLSKFQLLVFANKTLAMCSTCSQAKSHQLSFNSSTFVGDVWGPSPTVSFSGNEYYVSFVNAYSRFIWLYPIQAKSDVFHVFKQFRSQVERHFNDKILSVQTDWGGEFKSLNTLFKKIGITHHVSCPHTHQQNGCDERKHHHIIETALALLAHSSLPTSFWDDACLTACYLINHMHTPNPGHQSPFHKLFHQELDYKFLKVFGCACYPHLCPYNNNKLQFHSL